MGVYSTLGSIGGGILGGAAGSLTGSPAGIIGGAGVGMSLGGAIGSEFEPTRPYQQVGGLTDEQITALAEAQRRRGMMAIREASGQAMQRGANTAAMGGTYGSGLMSRKFGEIASESGRAAGDLEAGITESMMRAYGNRQFAPPEPGFWEKVGPQLTGFGAPLLASGITQGLSPAVTGGEGGRFAAPPDRGTGLTPKMYGGGYADYATSYPSSFRRGF